MEKFKHLDKIKEIYAEGGNVIQYLRGIDKDDSRENTIEDILISYDFQSGSYIKSYASRLEYMNNYCQALATIIDDFGDVDSIMEVGVGEATTLKTLLDCLSNKPKGQFGFDISWSRVKFAKEFLNDFNYDSVQLFTANLFEIPLADNSIDVVYTSHSIEPNGGKEKPALEELYRITRKYLVLLEPSYDFANEEARERMVKHGYVTALYQTALDLDYKIIENRLFDYCSNVLNPTGLIIIEKNDAQPKTGSNFVCPLTKTSLEKYDDHLLYSNESFLAYPVVDGIPCLLKENSILATKLKTDFTQYKASHNIVY